MSTASTVRGGPSQLHEARVELLGTLASLSGYEDGPDVLPDGTRPDLLRVRTSDRSIFIGDAKATETPGNRETYERLSHYASVLAAWTRQGSGGVFALAVEASDAYGWLRTLRALLSASGGPSIAGRIDVFDTDTAVIWHDGRRPERYEPAAGSTCDPPRLVESTSVGGLV